MIYYIWTTCDMFFTLMWCHLWSIRNLWMFLNISSALERFLARICLEISCDVFEFTKNLACIVHANRRSQREKYKLTAWNSGQILKLSILGAASSSSVIQRLHTERGSALCELLKCCCLGTIILTTACF